MDNTEVIGYWLQSSKEDLMAAEELYRAKRYHHALFFLHLAIEKILKGIYVDKNEKSPLPIHNLTRLAEQCDIQLDENSRRELNEITTFNISARYDDYKFKFYKKATKEFAVNWLEIGKKLYGIFRKKLEGNT